MTLQLEVGKTYRTRSGALAKILHKLSNNQSDPYLGITEFNTPHETARRWNPDGTFISAHRESHLDIIAEAKLWDGWEIDKPVWVRDHSTEKWVPRHFAGEHNGRPTAWDAGYTSHSQRGHGPVLWHFVTDVNPYKD